ncbi:MAG: type II toxin-antitoxin system RelE/ParE family toxin [bacterium]|nr:type II toxin-antitoxin system RelE/ParE family toxin [bacterium]
MESESREVVYYKTGAGKVPFLDWLYSLKDKITRARIRIRIERVAMGNFGDHHSVGNGVWELRVSSGPGFRIYYGLEGKKIVVVLAGGDKRSQEKDVKLAKEYWADYLRED